LPNFVAPQFCLLREEAPTGDRWVHELKYDGYRLHARLDRGKVHLRTRTGLDWTHRYGATAEALSGLRADRAYLDGELCAVRPDGTTSFAAMQAATDSNSSAEWFSSYSTCYTSTASTCDRCICWRAKLVSKSF
jgi:ATP-dependent DNA ligase